MQLNGSVHNGIKQNTSAQISNKANDLNETPPIDDLISNGTEHYDPAIDLSGGQVETGGNTGSPKAGHDLFGAQTSPSKRKRKAILKKDAEPVNSVA